MYWISSSAANVQPILQIISIIKCFKIKAFIQGQRKDQTSVCSINARICKGLNDCVYVSEYIYIIECVPEIIG